MKKRIWLHISDSFGDAQEFDKTYYLMMSGEAKLEAVQILREVYFNKFRKEQAREGRKRLRRVVQVIQQT